MKNLIKENYGLLLVSIVVLLIIVTFLSINKENEIYRLEQNQESMAPFMKVFDLMDQEEDQKAVVVREVTKWREIRGELNDARQDATMKMYGLTGFNIE